MINMDKLYLKQIFEEINKLDRFEDNYFQQFVSIINNIIKTTNLKFPYNDSIITKLKCYEQHGNKYDIEKIAQIYFKVFTKDNKEYNTDASIINDIKKEIDNLNKISVQFSDELETEHFKNIYIPFVQELNKAYDNELKYVWIDVGNVVYDIHLELINFKNEATDIYLNIPDNKDDLVTSFGNGLFSRVVSKESIDNLIKSIEEVKQAKENLTFNF